MFKYGLALCALLALVLGGSASALVAQERQGPPPRGIEQRGPETARAVPRGEDRPMRGPMHEGRQVENARPMPGNSPGFDGPFPSTNRPRDGRGRGRGPQSFYRDIDGRYVRHGRVRDFFAWIPYAYRGLPTPFVAGVVEFVVTPQFTRIYVNDRYAGMVYDLRDGIALAPGHYRLKLVCNDVVIAYPIDVQPNRVLVIRTHMFD